MTTEGRPNNKQLVLLIVAVMVPITATIKLLSIWLPTPFAGALSVFVWYLAIYWIPPRPTMSPWRWLIIITLLSVMVFVLARFQIIPF